MAKWLAIIALALAAFGSSLWSPFFFDDYSLQTDPAVTRPDGLLELLRPERTRPLAYITFWANYQAGGFEPFGYHFVNLALFGLIVWLAGRVFEKVADERAAWIALVIFALHPLQSEPVAYVFGRATLLATLFCLLSWRAWLGGRPWRAVAWFAVAMLAKEEAAALPVFLAGFEWFHQRRRQGWRELAAPLAAMLALVGVFAARLLYATRVIEGAGAGLDLGAITPWTYLLTQGRAIWLYLRLLIAPYGQNFDWDFRLSEGLDFESALAWAALAAVVGLALWLTRRWPPAWWLAGGLVLLAPTSSFAPLADLVVERRMFLPMLSLSLFAGAAAAHIARRRAWVVAVVLGAALAYASWNRTRDYYNEYSLWVDAYTQSPNKIRPHLQLARVFGKVGDPAKQRWHLSEAQRLAPDNPEVLGELGVYFLQGSQATNAAETLQRATELDPADAQLHTNLGTALVMLDRTSEGEQRFRVALQLDVCNFDARNNLMLVLKQRGAADEARALAHAPADCPFSQEQLDALRLAREGR